MVDDDLTERLSSLGECVRASVARRRSIDPNPDRPVPRHVRLRRSRRRVARRPGPSDRSARTAPDRPDHTNRAVGRSFGLDELDIGLLTVAITPDLDERFERLYGYLHDDITRRRASPGLALELCGRSPADTHARRAVSRPGRLVDGHLLEIEDGERPLLTRTLRVPDRVIAHLLGDDSPTSSCSTSRFRRRVGPDRRQAQPHVRWPPASG